MWGGSPCLQFVCVRRNHPWVMGWMHATASTCWSDSVEDRITRLVDQPIPSPSLRPFHAKCGRTTELANLQRLSRKDEAPPIPDQEIHPVGALRVKNVDRAGERIRTHRVTHQSRGHVHAAEAVAGRPVCWELSTPGE